jgi:hypothetical protein
MSVMFFPCLRISSMPGDLRPITARGPPHALGWPVLPVLAGQRATRWSPVLLARTVTWWRRHVPPGPTLLRPVLRILLAPKVTRWGQVPPVPMPPYPVLSGRIGSTVAWWGLVLLERRVTRWGPVLLGQMLLGPVLSGRVGSRATWRGPVPLRPMLVRPSQRSNSPRSTSPRCGPGWRHCGRRAQAGARWPAGRRPRGPSPRGRPGRDCSRPIRGHV